MAENLYDGKENHGIYELDSKTLSGIMDKPESTHDEFKNKVYMLVFYAPWCGHCKNMVDNVTKLGSNSDNSKFVIGTINCDKHEDVAEKYKISGFPSIFFVSKKGVEKYNEARDLSALTSKVENLTKASNLFGGNRKMRVKRSSKRRSIKQNYRRSKRY